MTDIVHHKEIQDRYFGDADLFDKVTRAMLYCHRSEMPVSKAFDKLDLDKQEKYDLTRWYMRKHGWFSGYVDKDELKFLCTIPVQDRNYITIPQYMDRQQAQSLEDDVEEYYNTRPVINAVLKSKPKPRKDIDIDEGDFI